MTYVDSKTQNTDGMEELENVPFPFVNSKLQILRPVSLTICPSGYIRVNIGPQYHWFAVRGELLGGPLDETV